MSTISIVAAISDNNAIGKNLGSALAHAGRHEAF